MTSRCTFGRAGPSQNEKAAPAQTGHGLRNDPSEIGTEDRPNTAVAQPPAAPARGVP
jgi:hypothetical protein